ncbi:ExbD/TolR family protein [Stratiformator vulcanicus]|nr:biopolymer transporter ExbD [Stratiformator vulcanicus]
MRIPRHEIDRSAAADQAMTPMIDVVFLLLIFFVCASVGQTPELLLATELAGGKIASSVSPEDQPPPLGELWIRLSRAGEATAATVNGVTHPDLDALEAVLDGLVEAEAASEMPAILDVGPEVPTGEVIRVYDACVSGGFQSIHFATDAE